MLFCPYCSNNLVIGSRGDDDGKAWVCPTCPYKWEMKKTISMRTHFKRKEVDDVLGGKDAWANVDKMPATCPACEGPSKAAFYMMLQIRSADEPATTFYKCVDCSHQWREN